MKNETIQFLDEPQIVASKGSVGLRTQLHGIATSVSAMAIATGGMKGGTLLSQNTNTQNKIK